LAAFLKKRKEQTTQAVKATPHIIKEKEPLWYRVPYSSSTAKRKRKINGD
jgi:hypothetical protein